MTSIHFPRSAFVGFDHLFDELEKLTINAKETYPPHNIVHKDDTNFDIEIAVAGFSREDLTIEVKDGILTVLGEKADTRTYAYKGISTRKFQRTFRLSEYVHITGADLQNGILVISLKIVIPEEKRPRKIQIGQNSEAISHDTKKEMQLLNESVK